MEPRRGTDAGVPTWTAPCTAGGMDEHGDPAADTVHRHAPTHGEPAWTGAVLRNRRRRSTFAGLVIHVAMGTPSRPERPRVYSLHLPVRRLDAWLGHFLSIESSEASSRRFACE